MARQQGYRSLDRTGTQAAIYPSEEELWIQGAPVTDPGDQGIAPAGGDQDGGPPPPGPTMTPQAEDAWIHEILNGETSNGAYGERWVNVEQHGPTGFGGWNEQPFETGHTQIVVSDPGSEQGWGVGPARRHAHYPHEESPNPYRNEGQHLRMGQLPWVTVDSSLYERSQLAFEQQWAPYKQRSPVTPIVPVSPSVPYAQTVPTFSGGPVQYPGIDIPVEAEGIW
jgi:hypothetical protein